MRILEMLEQGKINTEEAEELLKSLGEGEVKPQVSGGRKKKSLKILVSEDESEKVNITLPLGLARGLLKFIPSSAKETLIKEDIDLDQLLSSIDELEEAGELVRIEDGEDRVIIKVE